MVNDASGAVLPGVTVEASSPALIEKVRSTVTDDTGQYRIVDLRAGTYLVTFTLPGFSVVKRENIELRGEFVATVNADLRVGNLEETITVTGESPTVDVQSARVQTIMDRDVLTAIPSSRSANGIQAHHSRLEQRRRLGRHHRRQRRHGRLHPRRPRIGFPDASRRHQHRMGRRQLQRRGLQRGRVAGGDRRRRPAGLGEAETAGLMLNVIPRDGGNRFTGTMFFSGANGSMQGSNYTDELRAAGLRSPQELKKVYDFNPMGGGRLIRDKLWFYLTYREVVAENTIPGMFFNKNAGDPTKWLVDFDTSRPAFGDSLTRNGIVRLTWQASPRNKISLSHSEQYDRQNKEGGGSATRTPEAQGMRLYTPGHIQAATWTSPFTNRLLSRGRVGATTCRATPTPRRASTARTTTR